MTDRPPVPPEVKITGGINHSQGQLSLLSDTSSSSDGAGRCGGNDDDIVYEKHQEQNHHNKDDDDEDEPSRGDACTGAAQANTIADVQPTTVSEGASTAVTSNENGSSSTSHVDNDKQVEASMDSGMNVNGMTEKAHVPAPVPASNSTDEQERAMHDKCCSLLQYLVISEEFQKTSKCFTKPFQDDSDWTENHFLATSTTDKTTATSQVAVGRNATTSTHTMASSSNGALCLDKTRDALYKMGKDRGLKVTTKMRVSELKEIIRTHLESGAEGSTDEGSEPVEDDDIDFHEDDTSDDHGVILTSYDTCIPFPKKEKEATTNTAQTQAPWLVIPGPDDYDTSSALVLGDAEEHSGLRLYLEHLKEVKDPQRFSRCGDDLNDMLPLLTLDDKPQANEGDTAQVKAMYDKVGNFIGSAVARRMQPAYKKLFDVQAQTDSDGLELIIGIGHVRMIATKKVGGRQEKSIVNGPLIDVPVIAKLHHDENGSPSIIIFPKADAEIVLNNEVFAAIIGGGKSNGKLIDDIYEIVASTDVSSLQLDNSKSFIKILRDASALRYGGAVRTIDDANARFQPLKGGCFVITDAWCLYSCKRKATVHSRDARNLMAAMKNGKSEITEPIRAILSGPDYQSKYLNRLLSTEEDRLVYPLPASKDQRSVGEELIVKRKPVVVLQGPPGTGKTQTSVNIAATALTKESVLVTSSNCCALQAFVDKLPGRLQNLVLNFASVEKFGVKQFQTALRSMIRSLRSAKEGESDIKRINKNINKLTQELQSTVEDFLALTESAQCLLQTEAFKNAVGEAAYLSMEAPWLVKAIVSGKLSCISDHLNALKKCVKAVVSLNGHYDYDFLSDSFIGLVEREASGDLKLISTTASTFKFAEALSPDEKMLKSIRLNGQEPTTAEDWQCALSFFTFKRDFVEPLRNSGCSDDLFYNADGSFSTKLVDLLTKAGPLEKHVIHLGAEEKESLKAIFKRAPSNKQQQFFRDVTVQRQIQEADLVYVKVIVALRAKLDESALSVLMKMSQTLDKMSSGGLSFGKAMSARSTAHFENFCRHFREAVPFMPFLVMSLKQVSTYWPPDHLCGVGIIDEASQSSCTAITFMARCKQLLVVGDGQQVSPTDKFVAMDRIQGLRHRLPSIPTAEQLLPGSSFFDLLEASFPSSVITLREHYRCLPEIIAISNDLWYDGTLIPLRPPSRDPALEDVLLVDGTRDSKGRVNVAEAEAICLRIVDEIKRTAAQPHFSTLMVISMGGAEQCKLIEKMVLEKTELLANEYGPDVVDRHKILYGTSAECQSAERDMVFLSAVYSCPSGKKLKAEENERGWNVALSRAKNKMILVRSIGVQNLQLSDIRSRIFRCFMNAGKAETYNVQHHYSALAAMNLGDPMVSILEDVLSSALEKDGYLVVKNGGVIWSNALRIESDSVSESGNTDDCALLHIENSGESTAEWEEMFDKQLSLERAGRLCLRVDSLKLALDFASTLLDVLDFLDRNGLPKSSNRKKAKTQAAASPEDTQAVEVDKKATTQAAASPEDAQGMEEDEMDDSDIEWGS